VRLAGRFRRVDPFFENGCAAAPGTPPANRPVGVEYCGEQVPGNRVSLVPGNLDKKTGQSVEWMARGTLRYQPRDRDQDWRLSIEGTRQWGDARVGQQIGTGTRGEDTGLANAQGYTDRDILEERFTLIAKGMSPPEARRKVSQNLNDRPLDRRPYRGDWNKDGNARLETFNATLSGHSGLTDSISLDTTASWIQYYRTNNRDTDLSPNSVFESDAQDKAWQYYLEAALNGELEDRPLRWNLGGFYLQERLRYDSRNFTGQTSQPPRYIPIANRRRYTQKDWSFGLWAAFEVDFLEAFTFQAGSRYNWERKNFDITERRELGERAPLEAGTARETWDSPTWVFSLRYEFNAHVAASMKYTRGWKAGTFNAIDTEGDLAGPETLDAFEWSLSASLFADRVDAKLWFFFYDYEDYQVFLLEDTTLFPNLKVRNASDAVNLGLEYEVVMNPLLGFVPESVEALRIEIRGSYLDTRFVDFTDQQVRLSTGGLWPVTVDFSGHQLPSAPQVQISGGAQWTFDLGRFGSITPRYDFSWSDDTPFDPAEGGGSTDGSGKPKFDKFTVGQRAYDLHHVRLTWATPADAPAAVELAGWCRNLTDERYKTYAADVSNFTKASLNFVGDPRSCGADLALRW
jgi:iron complex outermembrane receptor protein